MFMRSCQRYDTKTDMYVDPSASFMILCYVVVGMSVVMGIRIICFSYNIPTHTQSPGL